MKVSLRWGMRARELPTSTTVKAARRMRLMGVSLRLTWRAMRRPMERRKAGKSIQELPCTASFTPGVNSKTAPFWLNGHDQGLMVNRLPMMVVMVS